MWIVVESLLSSRRGGVSRRGNKNKAELASWRKEGYLFPYLRSLGNESSQAGNLEGWQMNALFYLYPTKSIF